MSLKNSEKLVPIHRILEKESKRMGALLNGLDGIKGLIGAVNEVLSGGYKSMNEYSQMACNEKARIGIIELQELKELNDPRYADIKAQLVKLGFDVEKYVSEVISKQSKESGIEEVRA